MTKIASFAAEARQQAGKGPARALRRDGRVPAVIYGEEKEPEAISLDARDLSRELHQPGFFRRLYDVAIDGSKQRVLPREVQRHPVTSVPLHVDFLRIGAGVRIAVAVAVTFENEELSPGLKRGGVLNVVRHEIELSCPADAIPDALRLDLTGLEIGDGVHISQVPLPPGVTPTITDRDFTIATIAAPTVVREEAAAAAAEAEAEEEAEVEVEGEAEVEAEAEGEGEGEAKAKAKAKGKAGETKQE